MNHHVEPGDCLLSVTSKYKFRKWETLFDYVDNKTLKENRSDPMCLTSEDKDMVKIPVKEMKTFAVSTNNTHTFTVPVLKAKFSLVLYDNQQKPMPDVKYKLEIDSEIVKEGQTGGDGLIECDISPQAENGVLTYYPYKELPKRPVIRNLKLGYLDPVETIGGKQARLNYQGFDCGKIDNQKGVLTNEGMDNFQRFRKTDPEKGLV